jgi:hypothetical protein
MTNFDRKLFDKGERIMQVLCSSSFLFFNGKIIYFDFVSLHFSCRVVTVPICNELTITLFLELAEWTE